VRALLTALAAFQIVMGDLATWYLASGAAVVAAVTRPAWRVPVLFLVAVQYALHMLREAATR
jgi:hypothetical protein